MVGFKNRYMVMEVLLDPNKEMSGDDSIVITQFNISKAIKDSILVNFGECGLASSLRSFQGSIKACKTAALKCDELKFEQYKLMVGARLSVDVIRHMQNCIEKIKILEH
ncbi:putative ribonuclease P/MRP subunit POP5 -like protein [Gossypium arboreum]|uniref:Putative ribonuclease P/MRP subunit POP5-like protein n=1 Tax=Gossypium arboreum TaxID=29729 RepID=A0A0B0NG82_GOSAR|nr:putative ribonuclease P/MRP subunit POP5 -like protein [Gossypium arboreum]KHG20945.1 putative ribonuclease P/MRP subunit POP5 -like protein [Gossypium arboreum]